MTATDAARLARIGELADRYTGAGWFADIAWQVMHKGVVVSEGVSTADKAVSASKSTSTSTSTSTSPIYRIYSMTKPVVAVVALQLIEEQRLSLKTNLADVLPEFSRLQVSQNGELESLNTPVTIEHLLTHTAGFSYDFLPDCPVAALYREAELSQDGSRSLASYIEALAQLPLCSQPGAEWRYSVSMDVLAHVLEKITNQDLPTLLESRVFAPLGMSDTGFSVNTASTSRLKSIYGARQLGEVMVTSTEPNELHQINVETSYPSNTATSNSSHAFYRGGHGLFSTLHDYVKFMRVLQDGCSADGKALLSRPMVQMMWKNRLAESQRPIGIGENMMAGYGWNLFGRLMLNTRDAEVLSNAGEGGWSGAASTYFWVDRQLEFSGIVLSQYLGSTTALGPSMQHMAYQALIANMNSDLRPGIPLSD